MVGTCTNRQSNRNIAGCSNSDPFASKEISLTCLVNVKKYGLFASSLYFYATFHEAAMFNICSKKTLVFCRRLGQKTLFLLLVKKDIAE